MPPDSTDKAASVTEEQGSKALTLDAILNGDDVTLDEEGIIDKAEGGWDEEVKEGEAAQGFCVECEGISSSVEDFTVFSLPAGDIRPTRTITL